MAFGENKYLLRRIEPDKVLSDRIFVIASNPKFYEYQRKLASMVYKFLKI